jgi:hypothetical protein
MTFRLFQHPMTTNGLLGGTHRERTFEAQAEHGSPIKMGKMVKETGGIGTTFG